MKNLAVIAFLLFSINTASAQNICSPSCTTLSITFPAGGSIDAIDAMRFSFGHQGVLELGEAGTVNTAVQPAVVDFAAGGELHLLAGESISFGSGGVLDLGVEGNMDAGHYRIVTTGDLVIVVTGSNHSVIITGGLEIQGGMTVSSGNLALNEDVAVDHDLTLSSGSTLTGSGVITIGSSGSILSGDTVIFNGGTMAGADLNLLVSGIEPLENLSLQPPVFNPDIQALQDLSMLEGLELVAGDGNSCVVSAEQCIAEDGSVYVLSEDGQLVRAASAGGVFDGISMLLMLLALASARNRKPYIA